MNKCSTPYCRNKTNSTYCSTCRSKKARAADKVKYAFTSLRNNAKRRGIIFTITLEQFKAFCSKVNYIGFAGRSSESYTIDRIHNDIGYHIDNIQVMEKGKNVKKYFYYDWREKQVRYERSEVVEGPF